MAKHTIESESSSVTDTVAERDVQLLARIAAKDQQALADLFMPHRKIKTFSGGMKRRVGIAQALLNNSQLLIVDEPTAGLDPEERIRFRNLLSDLGGDRTILLSTHIVEDIAQTCNRLAVMKNGRVIFQGTAQDLIRQTGDRVWSISTQGIKPEDDFTIVSTLNMGGSIQYRVVGQLPAHTRATPVEPSLEDGYVWLMRDQHVPLTV